jgi:micrococcal nuclease
MTGRTAKRIFATLSIAILIFAVAIAKAPPAGYTTECRIIDVYDGDTITVEITKRLKVRMLDCWAPEVRGNSREEGLISRDTLRNLALDKDAIIHIPAANKGEIWRIMTFGRVLAHVWVKGHEKNLSEQMVETGHATLVK